MVTFKQLAKELAGDEWTLGYLSGVHTEEFWTWSKTDTIGYDGNPYLAIDKCVNFDRELWFDMGNLIWRKHRSAYQYHMKYVLNDIVKTFKVKILRYSKRVREIHKLAKHLPPPSMKGESAISENWSVRNEEFNTSDIKLSIRDWLPKETRDELDEHPEEYCYLTYEDWFNLLSTTEVKD